jgi:peptide/nickel transport system substrate-binding protein
MAMLMQNAAGKAGIGLDIQRRPTDGYWAHNWMKDPVGFGNLNGRPTADIIFTQLYASHAAWNESGWRNERFDRLLLEARGSTDEGCATPSMPKCKGWSTARRASAFRCSST